LSVLPRLFALAQKIVMEPATLFQVRIQQALLPLARVEPVLERLEHTLALTPL
jgi:hypothetical protein